MDRDTAIFKARLSMMEHYTDLMRPVFPLLKEDKVRSKLDRYGWYLDTPAFRKFASEVSRSDPMKGNGGLLVVWSHADGGSIKTRWDNKPKAWWPTDVPNLVFNHGDWSVIEFRPAKDGVRSALTWRHKTDGCRVEAPMDGTLPASWWPKEPNRRLTLLPDHQFQTKEDPMAKAMEVEWKGVVVKLTRPSGGIPPMLTMSHKVSGPTVSCPVPQMYEALIAWSRYSHVRGDLQDMSAVRGIQGQLDKIRGQVAELKDICEDTRSDAEGALTEASCASGTLKDLLDGLCADETLANKDVTIELAEGKQPVVRVAEDKPKTAHVLAGLGVVGGLIWGALHLLGIV